jgi:hypothetical protein
LAEGVFVNGWPALHPDHPETHWRPNQIDERADYRPLKLLVVGHRSVQGHTKTLRRLQRNGSVEEGQPQALGQRCAHLAPAGAKGC